jgi:hypothetical protein
VANILTHRFVSPKPAGADATKVRSPDWNEGHIFTGGSDGAVLVRDTSDPVYGAAWSTAFAKTPTPWTPVIGGATSESGQSYLFQNGLYVKDGPLVHVWGLVALQVEGTITGNLRIKGLPHPSVPTVVQTVCAVNWSGLSTSWVNIQLVLNPSTSSFLVLGNAAASASFSTQLTAADVEAGSAFSFNTTYLTDE